MAGQYRQPEHGAVLSRKCPMPWAASTRRFFREQRLRRQQRRYSTRNSVSSIPTRFSQTIRPYINEPLPTPDRDRFAKFNLTSIYSVAPGRRIKLGMLVHRNKIPLVVAVVELNKTQCAFLPFRRPAQRDARPLRASKICRRGGTGYDSVGRLQTAGKPRSNISNGWCRPPKTADRPVRSNGLAKLLPHQAIQHFVPPSIPCTTSAISPSACGRSIHSRRWIFISHDGDEQRDLYLSYKPGFFRMLQRLGAEPHRFPAAERAFRFLQKFIKMAANYNKLDTFRIHCPNNRPKR